MKFTDLLSPKLILPNIESITKIDCLMEFAQAIAIVHPELKKDEITHILFEREKLGSTGIQDAVAIPHGKIKTLKESILLFGRSLKGVDFQAFDNKPTQLFFVLLAPLDATSEHLKLLARLSKILKQNVFREQLLEAKDSEEIYQLLSESDQKF